MRSFAELLDEAQDVPVDGWDFSWFAGRATEERTPWGYTALLAAHMSGADRALDIQTGGGEVLAGLTRAPRLLRATEAWPPNVALARQRLSALGAEVVESPEDAPLPFADAAFDLVAARHPVRIDLAEVARVLSDGGTLLTQLVGAGSNRQLFEYLMGPQEVGHDRWIEPAARAAALDVVELRSAACRVEFFDVGAVVVFLRKVIWTVPDFSVRRYRDRLRDLDRQIRRDGVFRAHSRRILVQARRIDR